jgi:hypothetical protein
MAQLVPTILTPSTPVAVAEAIARVWGLNLTNQVLWLLLAHSDLETAGWTRMYNYNLGNIIRTAQWKGDWFDADDSGNPRQFRAYPSLDSGASGLVVQLTSSTRPQWRAGLLSGDPTTYVAALAGKHGGPAYFEADPSRYLTGFMARYQRYAGIDYLQNSSLPDVDTPVSSEVPIWYAMAIAGLAAALVVWQKRQ